MNIKKQNVLWADVLWAVILLFILLDFILSYFGIVTKGLAEMNPYTAPLWKAREWISIFTYMFFITPFTLYGVWVFWGRNNKLLYFNIVYYGIVLANNLFNLL